jgi:hypothetical protein
MTEERLWKKMRWGTERHDYKQGYVRTEAVSDVEK